MRYEIELGRGKLLLKFAGAIELGGDATRDEESL